MMGLPQYGLGADERPVVVTRTHPKTLLGPALLAAAALAGLAAALAIIDEPAPRWAAIAVVAAVAAAGVVVPAARWWSTSYTITTRRVMVRSGLLKRTGRDIPIRRINSVSIERHLSDRLCGCGSLVICDASDQAGLTIRDVPHVARVHARLADLLAAQTS